MLLNFKATLLTSQPTIRNIPVQILNFNEFIWKFRKFEISKDAVLREIAVHTFNLFVSIPILLKFYEKIDFWSIFDVFYVRNYVTLRAILLKI